MTPHNEQLVLGIIRKSPTKMKEVQTSVEIQRELILNRLKQDVQAGLLDATVRIIWAIDVCKGDDPRRLHLLEALDTHAYARAYCLNVDRFSRSWLGIKWLHEYFTDGVQLHFVEGIGDLYLKDGGLNDETYLFFFMQCGFAQYELLKIRKRAAAGRAKLTPEEWAAKYRGRKKGAKNIGKPKYLSTQRQTAKQAILKSPPSTRAS